GTPHWTPWPALTGCGPDGARPGLLPFRLAVGGPMLAVYGRTFSEGSPDMKMSLYDGSTWTEAVSVGVEPPALARSADHSAGSIPLHPSALAGSAPWTIRHDDRLIPVDVNGDGAVELVAIAAAAGPDGRRRIAVLAGQEAGLPPRAAAWGCCERRPAAR